MVTNHMLRKRNATILVSILRTICNFTFTIAIALKS